MDQAELTRSLLRPEAWRQRVERVELIETHISLLFLAGQRVYKVKKPVDFGFLDFSTLERRRHFCEEEVRLNRRLAGDVYLGVVPILRSADGQLGLDGEGRPVEWAVEMRRLPARSMLDRMLAEGRVDNAQMNALAQKLADFHAAAATGPGVDEHGAPEAVAFNVIENFDQTRDFAGEVAEIPTLSAELHAFLERRARSFLEAHRPLFEQRVRSGRIREGHGDLHAGNVCYLPSGLIVYDCIEFADRFRCGDVACDLAFLTMDLDRGGYRAFARYLTRRYAERASDDGLGPLMPFYAGYRAVVRAKVAGLRAAGAEGAAREEARREAQAYFHLAASYELPPALILTSGPPAGGKSRAARAVARPFGAVLKLSAAPRHTYASLLEGAAQALARGRTVVVDASFPSAACRAPFAELAARSGAPFAVVHAGASEERTRRRLEARAGERGGSSPADMSAWARARASFEPPDELPPERRVDHLSGVEPELDLTGRVIDALVRQVSGG